MLRMFVLVPVIASLLTGCGDPGSEAYDARYAEATAPAQPPMGAIATDATLQRGVGGGAQTGESFTYDHTLAVSMASDRIKARFERARDRCQSDAALKCKVVSASFNIMGNPNAPLPVAYLSVALPHDGITVFEASLLVPLPDEEPGDVVVRSRAMTAQNVTQQVTDLDRRLAQLADYRDRLSDLSKRRNATTDDLIKIEGELSKTQSDLEQLDAQKRQLAERIAKENMNITFEAQSTAGDAFQPVRDVFQSSLRILGQSTGEALSFLIRLLPWLPVIALALYAIAWLWRRLRRKPA